LGRMDLHGLSRHAAEFLGYLRAAGRLSVDVSPALVGHAYALYGRTSRQVAGEGVVLIGDAAGVAYAQSGEGIRPAIESGLLAADVVTEAQGRYTRERLERYRFLLAERFGKSGGRLVRSIAQHLPAGLATAIGRRLLLNDWFVRRVVLDEWFLHRHERAPHSSSAD